MIAGRSAVVAVWVATLVAVIVVVALVPGAPALTWLAVTLSLAVVVGMVGQLIVGEQRGFVVRLSAAAAGSFVLVVVAAGVALALA